MKDALQRWGRLDATTAGVIIKAYDGWLSCRLFPDCAKIPKEVLRLADNWEEVGSPDMRRYGAEFLSYLNKRRDAIPCDNDARLFSAGEALYDEGCERGDVPDPSDKRGAELRGVAMTHKILRRLSLMATAGCSYKDMMAYKPDEEGLDESEALSYSFSPAKSHRDYVLMAIAKETMLGNNAMPLSCVSLRDIAREFDMTYTDAMDMAIMMAKAHRDDTSTDNHIKDYGNE